MSCLAAASIGSAAAAVSIVTCGNYVCLRLGYLSAFLWGKDHVSLRIIGRIGCIRVWDVYVYVHIIEGVVSGEYISTIWDEMV